MNHDLFHLINGWAGHNVALDDLMIFCARWLIYVVFAVAAVCGLRLARARAWRPLAYFVATLVVSFVFLQLAGHLYVDQRPFMTQRVHQLVAHAAGTAFPSDHTTAATAVGLGLLVFTTFRKTGALLVLAAVVIGFARIFVGIHWPVDIAGALLTGLAGTAAVFVVVRLADRRKSEPLGPEARRD